MLKNLGVLMSLQPADMDDMVHDDRAMTFTRALDDSELPKVKRARGLFSLETIKKVVKDLRTNACEEEIIWKQVMEVLESEGLDPEKVKAGKLVEIASLDHFHVYKWVRESSVPAGEPILTCVWVLREKGDGVRARLCLRDYATTWRDDVYAPTPTSCQ